VKKSKSNVTEAVTEEGRTEHDMNSLKIEYITKEGTILKINKNRTSYSAKDGNRWTLYIEL
jgi:hypothetical protein